MSKKLLSVISIMATSILVGCSGSGDGGGVQHFAGVVSEDGMVSYATPNIELKDNCFYEKTKATLPVEKETRQYRWYKWVVFKVESGGFPRQYQLVKGSPTDLALNKFVREMTFKAPYEAWNKKPHYMQRDATQPSQTVENGIENILSTAPSGDFQPIPLGQINTEAGLTNPMNVELHTYSRVYYVVLNDDIEFARKSPHRVQVGKPSNLPPYYGPSDVSSNAKTISFDYFSHPDFITDRECTYKYELELQVERTVGGRTFTVPIIIDPGETNDGSPPPADENGSMWP